MTSSYSAIVLVAGKGTRCDLPVNKVLYEVNGKAIFTYSLEVFLEDERCKKIIVVHSESDTLLVEKYLSKYMDKRIVTTLGGKERQNSVLKGLAKVDTEYVLVHDGARANINRGLIDRVLEGFEKSDVVSPGVKVSDTIKKVTSKVETIDRSDLYYMQTPQGSKVEVLKSCLEKAINDNINVTDDLMAIEKYSNVIPKIVLGDKTNIKVTTLDDIELLKFYME